MVKIQVKTSIFHPFAKEIITFSSSTNDSYESILSTSSFFTEILWLLDFCKFINVSASSGFLHEATIFWQYDDTANCFTISKPNPRDAPVTITLFKYILKALQEMKYLEKLLRCKIHRSVFVLFTFFLVQRNLHFIFAQPRS